MKLVVTRFQWIYYNQDGIGVDLQVPQQTEEPKLLEMLYNHRDTQLVMIQEITTEEPKLLEMLCNQRDSQLVMIQEITTEEPKLLEMLCNKRDSHLFMI
jgi:hypothetical protein